MNVTLERALVLAVAIGMPASAVAQPAKPAPTDPGPKLWVNYDFVPGNRVIFFTDYADDQVGNFPNG